MSEWICCNSCFKSAGRDRQLALTNCGHIICSVCFQKGKEGECLICKAECQLSPLSDKSSSAVKALFSDIGTVAVKYFSEISKVLQFQARHQKRLLAHYQQKSEQLKEALIKMQQEMQQMSKKMTEQNTYISKLEVALQQQSSRLGSESNRDLHATDHFKPVHFCSPSTPVSSMTKIPYSSPASISRHLSTTSLSDNMDVDSRTFSKKPSVSGSVSRLCLISPPQDGRIGMVPHRASSQSTMSSHSVRSTTVSRSLGSVHKEPALASPSSIPYCRDGSRGLCTGLKEAPLDSPCNVPHRRDMQWGIPVFKVPPTYKYPSMSSLGPSTCHD